MRMRLCAFALILFFVTSAHAGQTLVLSNSDMHATTGPVYQDFVLKEAFRRIGVRIKIINLPAERTLINVNEGIDDGTFVRIAGLEQDYPNMVMVPEVISVFDFIAYSKNPSIVINGWDSLRPYNVGIIVGWKILEANIKDTKSLMKVNDDVALFELLRLGRADIVIYDRRGGEVARHLNIEGAHALGPPLATRELFLYLNSRHAAMVPKVAVALRDMKRDGTFERIKNSTEANH